MRPNAASVGGVICDPAGQCLSFLVKMFLATSWLNYLIAAALWERLFSHAHVVYYIDNESSHVAYIRGDGETVKASSLIQSVVQVESDLHHRVCLVALSSTMPSVSVQPEQVLTGRRFQTTLDLEEGRSSEGAESFPCEKVAVS